MLITKTDRLVLRHVHIGDFTPMAELFADPEVMRFGPGPRSREWVAGWVRGCLEDYYQKWGFGLWAVVEKAERQVIGFCGLTQFDDIDGKPETEIGYRLRRQYWGHGYATEAAHAVCDHAFAELTIPRLIALIDPANTASIHVAEKIGMHYEKDVLFREKPVRVYAITAH